MFNTTPSVWNFAAIDFSAVTTIYEFDTGNLQVNIDPATPYMHVNKIRYAKFIDAIQVNSSYYAQCQNEVTLTNAIDPSNA